jgi:L-ascorbate metabolism protein UlaG (beta-lactamase superfamily)
VIEPLRQGTSLVAEMRANRTEETRFHLWWLGQSGFVIGWRDRFAVIDPYLSDSLTRKYAGTDLEHVRMTARCVDPEQLGFVDVAVSTHAHTDHLDAETLVPMSLARNEPLPLMLPEATFGIAQQRLSKGHFVFHGLDSGIRKSVAGFEFTGIAAAHNTVERDENGRCKFLGYVIRFGPWTVYHSGDTRWHEELPGLVKAAKPDVMLLPINGAQSARVAGNLTGSEAAQLAAVCGAPLVIPHHFEMFEFNTASPGAFQAECERLGQPYRILRCGEHWDSSELRQRVSGD